MSEVYLMFVTAIAFIVGVYLVTTADKGAPQIAGVVIVTVLAISTLMQMSVLLAQWNVLGDVMIFVATLAGCAALVGGVVYYVKHRPARFVDMTQDAPGPTRQTNYVTPGTQTQYEAEAPAMRKRGRF